MHLLEINEDSYYAVIFTSLKMEEAKLSVEYGELNDQLEILAKEIDGFLGMESVREELGISISYWRDLNAIDAWRKHWNHIEAKKKGRKLWYEAYSIRICKVEYQNYFKP